MPSNKIAYVVTVDERGGVSGIKRFTGEVQKSSKTGQSSFSALGDKVEAFGSKARSVGLGMTAALTLPLVLFGQQVLSGAGDFELGMNRVSAISGATETQLASLTAQARELGGTTQFTAQQSADAMGFLAQAGNDVNQIMSSMPGVLQLAASAQLDMGSAADIVTNIMAGYRLETHELGRANDVLVKAFTSANTNLLQLAEAMKYAGANSQRGGGRL